MYKTHTLDNRTQRKRKKISSKNFYSLFWGQIRYVRNCVCIINVICRSFRKIGCALRTKRITTEETTVFRSYKPPTKAHVHIIWTTKKNKFGKKTHKSHWTCAVCPHNYRKLLYLLSVCVFHTQSLSFLFFMFLLLLVLVVVW